MAGMADEGRLRLWLFDRFNFRLEARFCCLGSPLLLLLVLMLWPREGSVST